MKRRSTTLGIFCVLFVGLILGGAYFVFNPLGLGPLAQMVLPDQFFDLPKPNGVALDLLVDGKEVFEAILDAIDAATSNIDIQIHIWKDDPTGRMVVERLIAAAHRGVKVRLNKDALGTIFEIGAVISGKPGSIVTRSGLKDHPNIQLRVTPFVDPNRSSYFIVDRRLVILGGIHISNECHLHCHDYMVQVSGAAWVEAFMKKVVNGEPWPEVAPFFIAVNDNDRVEIRTALIEIIDRARQTIVIEHTYFSTRKVVAAIQRALLRGIPVSIILPKAPQNPRYANRLTINRLLQSAGENAPKIFLSPQNMHARAILVDGKIAAVGSANLTLRSMLTNREVTLFFHGKADHPFIRRLRGQLVVDLLNSERVTIAYDMDLTARLKAKIEQYLW